MEAPYTTYTDAQAGVTKGLESLIIIFLWALGSMDISTGKMELGFLMSQSP